MSYHHSSKRTLLVAAAAVLLSWPAMASAQTRVSVGSQGGVALPASRLADVVDAGPTVGLHLAYQVGPRVALNVGGDVDLLSGARLGGVQAPDVRLWHYAAGVQVQMLQPRMTRWSLLANWGVGATRFDSDRFTAPGGSPTEFGQTYFMTQGGLRLGYAFSPKVNTFVGGRANWTFADKEDTAALAALSPSVEPFNTAWTFPITAGLNVRI